MNFWEHHILQLLATSVAILVPVWIMLRGLCHCIERKVIEMLKTAITESNNPQGLWPQKEGGEKK
jgi:hypothetical protein